MALLDDIHTQLTSQSVIGGATGWTGFKGGMPEDSGGKAIAIFETGGSDPDNTSGTAYETVNFQLMGRGAEWGYEALRAKMQDAFDALNDATITNYVFINGMNSAPISLGFDKNNRPLLVWNFEAMVLRSAL